MPEFHDPTTGVLKPFTQPSTPAVISPLQPTGQGSQVAQQTVSQGTAQPMNVEGAQVDPSIVALMHGLKKNESPNGDYNAIGDQGTAAGIGQWSNQVNGKVQPLQQGQIPANFAGDAKQFGLDPTDFSPANQNKVMYAVLSQDKAQGLTPEQALSKWNSGDPNKYQSASAAGTGQVGAYDVASYVQKGMAAAQQYASQNAQNAPVGNINQPAGQSGDGSSFFGDLGSGNLLGAAEKAGDFAFPIVSDLAKDFEGTSTKSGLQQLGDAGLSALWFLPFGGIADAATDVARAGLGLAEASKAAKVIGGVATGLGAGYVGDVSSNLSQGKTGLDAAKPGLGTVIGGVLPGALAGAGSLYQKFAGDDAILTKVQQAYEDAAGATKSGIKAASKTAAKGLDANPEFLAHAGILPETDEINGRRVFTTGEDSSSQKEIQGRITELTNLRDEAIAKAGTDHPMYLEEMRQSALERADQEFAGTAKETVENHINAEFDAYKGQFGDKKGNISLTEANEIKKDLQGKTNYDATRPTTITRANSLMANVAKTAVEEGADSAGLKGVKSLNQIIQQHIDAKAFLSRINGQTVKGGRIGKHLYEGAGLLMGSAVGKAVGAMVGSPTVGEVVGTAAGGLSGKIISSFVQKLSAGGTVSAASIGRMASKEPEAVQNFLEYLGKQGKIIAPVIKPSEKTGVDTIQEVLSKSPGDAVLKAFNREEAKAVGYTDEEIDSFLNSEQGK